MEQHSRFVRISIYILAAFVASLIVFGFFFAEPRYQLSAEITSLVLLLVVLFLSESFNNLSIGKLFTLSRENKKKKEENRELKFENKELRNQLITVATNVSQSQVTFNGLTPELLRTLNVVPADESEKQAKEKLEENPATDGQVSGDGGVRDTTPKTELQKLSFGHASMKLTRLLEPRAISSFANSIGIPSEEIRHDVRFASAFEGLDPVMESPVVFDAYYQLEGKELFFEVIRADTLRPDRFYYLYQMLTKLFLYRNAKGSKAELVLIAVELPEEIRSRFGSQYKGMERLGSQFAPAVANRLLRIEKVSYSEDEVLELLRNDAPKRQR